MVGWGIGLLSWTLWYMFDPERENRVGAEQYVFFLFALLLGLLLSTAGHIWLASRRPQRTDASTLPVLDPQHVFTGLRPLELVAFVIAFLVVPLLLLKSNDATQMKTWQDRAVGWVCLPAALGIARWGWRLWKAGHRTEAILAWMGALCLGAIPVGSATLQRIAFGAWSALMIVVGYVRHLHWLQWEEAERRVLVVAEARSDTRHSP